MLPQEELRTKLKKYLTKYDLSELTEEQFNRMIEITYEPLTLLSDITDAVSYFFGGDKVEVDEKAQAELDTELSQDVLKSFIEQAEGWDWSEENLHEVLAEFRAKFKEEKGYKPKFTMWAVRAAVTGRLCGADMVATLAIIGKENSIKRAKAALKTANV